MTSPAFPRIARADAPLIVIGTRYADGPGEQRRMADAAADQVDSNALGEDGPASAAWFLSTDGETVLTCTQWADDAAHDAYLRDKGPAAPLAGPRHRLHRSLAEDGETRVPGCLVTAAFDVDGPERQRHFADAVIAAQPRQDGHPGAISAHFLLSADGSRVLLYTEWTSAEAHSEAAEAGDHDKGHEIFSGTPGVRPTGGNRYHLHRTTVRPLP